MGCHRVGSRGIGLSLTSFFGESVIRTKALEYFGRFHTNDTTIVSLVIQAVEKYGRDN